VTNDQHDAARRLAIAVTSARLLGRPLDQEVVERHAAAVLGEVSQGPPPANDSLAAQLSWATAELTNLVTWIDGLPESLARICTACADVSVEAIRELAELKQNTVEAELHAVTTRIADASDRLTRDGEQPPLESTDHR
jgi:hypothetical protein